MMNQDQRIAKMSFASVYPHYLEKIKKKGRTQEELLEIITWLTGFDSSIVQLMIDKKVSFEEFFQRASLNKDAMHIKGVICGYRVEEIKNELTQKVRYLDKIVDELAKGKTVDKIINRNPR